MKIIHVLSMFVVALALTGVASPVSALSISPVSEPDGWPSWIGRLDEVQSPFPRDERVSNPPTQILDPRTGEVRAELLESGEWSDGWPSWIGRI